MMKIRTGRDATMTRGGNEAMMRGKGARENIGRTAIGRDVNDEDLALVKEDHLGHKRYRDSWEDH
jgi:hypothetical protein